LSLPSFSEPRRLALDVRYRDGGSAQYAVRVVPLLRG
jgi:hypothetical protein